MQTDCEKQTTCEKPERPPNLSKQPDVFEGILLFRARMIVAGLHKQWQALAKEVKATGKTGEQWYYADRCAAQRMGYEGFDDELKRYTAGSRPASTPLDVDAVADLKEAYGKFETVGLDKTAFHRPNAWFWYQQYYDPEIRKDVVKLVAANLVAPQAKAKAQVESTEDAEAAKEEKSQMEELERFIRERKGE